MKINFNIQVSSTQLWAFAFILLASSCDSSNKRKNEKFDLAVTTIEIEEQNVIFIEAMNNGDSAAVANCYTKDAKLMRPNAEAISGRNNIRHIFSTYMKGGTPKFTLSTVEIWGNEDLLVSEDEWMFTDENGKQIDHGKSLVLWKKQEGKWKIFRDCYNSDIPNAK